MLFSHEQIKIIEEADGEISLTSINSYKFCWWKCFLGISLYLGIIIWILGICNYFEVYLTIPMAFGLLILLVFPLLLVKWIDRLKAKLLFEPASLDKSTHLLIIPKNEELKSSLICLSSSFIFENSTIKTFTFRFIKYSIQLSNTKIESIEYKYRIPHSQLESYGNISHSLRKELLNYYGPCLIDIPMKRTFQILVDEIIHPFFIFQVICILAWLEENYYMYSSVIAFSSLLSICAETFETKSNLKKLRKMALFECRVNILEGDKQEKISSHDLVPGDIIELSSGLYLPCDVALLNGTCVTNESNLTGESVPAIKNPLPNNNNIFDPEGDSYKFTLFQGSNILQSIAPQNKISKGLVIRTGFTTSKGNLMRKLLNPKTSDLSLYKDSYKFLIIMFAIGIIGLSFSLQQIMNQEIKSYKKFLMDILEPFSIIIPPELPLIFTVGIEFAIERLKKSKIFCICPPKINAAGKIDTICFDKTGTLTEDGLNFEQVATFQQDINQQKIIHYLMASCHTIQMLNEEIIGDPLDLEMFKEVDAIISKEAMQIGQRIIKCSNGVLMNVFKMFTFESKLQRMSVLVEINSTKYAFVKGSPEQIKHLCNTKSIPLLYSQKLQDLTQEGKRIIAIAYKEVSTFSEINRQEAENNLNFLGLLVFQNQIKKESPFTIRTLHEAGIHTIMITGDNLLTAINVAKKCDFIHTDSQLFFPIIKNEKLLWRNQSTQQEIQEVEEIMKSYAAISFGISSDSYQYLLKNSSEELILKIFKQTIVFARMKPCEKAQLIETLIKKSKTEKKMNMIAMIGDGANDCAALKTAHVGISLSEAEASIAAPFTSQINNISCLISLLEEGRAALHTSFEGFKFLILTAVIQYASVSLLRRFSLQISDEQFLFLDLILSIPFSMTISWSKARKGLSHHQPSCSLFDFNVLFRIFGHMISILAFQIWAIIDIQKAKFYLDTNCLNVLDPEITSYENTAIFILSTFQYVIVSFICSFGGQFREPFYRNIIFLINLIFGISLCIFILFNTDEWLISLLGLVKIPSYYRWTIFEWVIINGGICCIIEFGVNYFCFSKFQIFPVS